MMRAFLVIAFLAVAAAFTYAEICQRLDVAIKEASSSDENALNGSVAAKPWISFEFFPPRSQEGVDALYNHVNTLKDYNPLFADMTWGAGGSTATMTMDLCIELNKRGLRVNMHLTCTNMDSKKVDEALKSCKEHGLVNILALRGDPPAGQQWTPSDGGFTCAKDLVEHIRSNYDLEDFCVTVAGYPEGHPSKMTKFSSLEDMSATELARHSADVSETGQTEFWACSDDDFKLEIAYLKDKVNAGANCIITQMFFDAEVFVSFVKACRAADITVPIIPGIMCISSYAGLKKMAKFCKTRVPDDMLRQVEELKEDDEGFKKYGIQAGVRMCRRLLEAGVPGLHFYTLNSSVTTSAILKELNLDPVQA